MSTLGFGKSSDGPVTMEFSQAGHASESAIPGDSSRRHCYQRVSMDLCYRKSSHPVESNSFSFLFFSLQFVKISCHKAGIKVGGAYEMKMTTTL